MHCAEVVKFKKDTDTAINIKVNPQRRSLKAILLLFMEPYERGARDSEKYVFPDLMNVWVTINGSPQMIYIKGIEGKYMWEKERKGQIKSLTFPKTHQGTDNTEARYKSLLIPNTLIISDLPTYDKEWDFHKLRCFSSFSSLGC